MNYKNILLITYIIYISIISLITFIIYGLDKRKAIKNTRRIKEKTLLFLSAFGGSLGAFLARIIFHHKTDKYHFSLVIYSSLILNTFILIMLID